MQESAAVQGDTELIIYAELVLIIGFSESLPGFSGVSIRKNLHSSITSWNDILQVRKLGLEKEVLIVLTYFLRFAII